MPITVNFQGIEPITQDIDEEYNIKSNYDYNDFNPDGLDGYVNKFMEKYKKKEDDYFNSLQRENISTMTDYGLNSSIYFGIDLNNINDTIKKIKEINEEEKNDAVEPCFNMIKYTRIRDSAIIPCKSTIISVREFDSPIIPCKSIIDSVRKIDSQFDKNQLSEILQESPLVQSKNIITPNSQYKIVDSTGRRYNILSPPTGRPSKPGLNIK